MILVCGDIHGRWGMLNALINRKQPEIILQVGDFGIFEKFNCFVEDIKPHDTKIYFCDGNHENFDILDDLRNKHGNVPIEYARNIFYCPRGSVLELPDKRKVLFMGGADSIDKNYRTIGVDWFKQEIISQSDIDGLPETDIDIVISHTCPLSVLGYLNDAWVRDIRQRDPSVVALDIVYEKYRPKEWYFGHWHVYKKFKHEQTVFTALSHNKSEQQWWITLQEDI